MFTYSKVLCILMPFFITSFAVPLSDVVIKFNFSPQALAFKSEKTLAASLSLAATPNLSYRDLFGLESLSVKANPHYTAGQRVAGDALVGAKKDYHTYDTPQSIQLKLTLPPLAGKKITFVEVDVEQSSNEGRAYISDGGIGQDHIEIIVVALDTTYFGYTAEIYAI